MHVDAFDFVRAKVACEPQDFRHQEAEPFRDRRYGRTDKNWRPDAHVRDGSAGLVDRHRLRVVPRRNEDPRNVCASRFDVAVQV